MPPAARARCAGTPGFTLLEMLIVMVLIAILAGLITVNARPDPRQALVEQARRAGLLFGVAAEEARLRRVPIDWEADLKGYRFVARADGERTTFDSDELLGERRWDPPLTRLAVVDLASGSARALVNPAAPALRVAAGREWVQPAWRLELQNEFGAATIDFDAGGHARVLP